MGRKYLCTLLMLYFQRQLIADDLVAERLAAGLAYQKHVSELERRMDRLEEKLEALVANGPRAPELPPSNPVSFEFPAIPEAGKTEN